MPEELDELNRLFTSKNAEDVIKFYDHFDTAEQLIEWMKNRPSAPMKIYEVEGEKDIVVVIPTANHEGNFAKNCANNIFKGQQIVFVESNGPFFNYARSCNYGLEYALKYNPKWIVLSNDDVISADSFNKLANELQKSNYNEVVYIANLERWGRLLLVKRSNLFNRYEKFMGYKDYVSIIDKFNINYQMFTDNTYKKPIKSFIRTFIINFFNKRVLRSRFSGDFIIFSNFSINNILSNYNKIFDETFINCCEDNDLFIRISMLKITISALNYDIRLQVSGTLGKGKAKSLRGIVSMALFDRKIKNNYNSLLD
jgi:hypothetical protein